MAKPRIEVLNKIDLLDDHQREGLLATRARRCGAEVSRLWHKRARGRTPCFWPSIARCDSDPILEAELLVPQQEGGVLAAIEAGMVIRG